MKSQILMWVLQRALAEFAPRATPSPLPFGPPAAWRRVALATVALGTSIGVVLTFALGVGLQALFNVLVAHDVQPTNAALIVAAVAVAVAGGAAYGVSTMWRRLLAPPVKPAQTLNRVVEEATGAVSDLGSLAVDLISAFIGGLDDGKPMRKRRVHVELDADDERDRATIIPLRRKRQ